MLVLNSGKKKKADVKANDKVDIRRLRELCLTKHGLVNDDIRMKAWPLLLNVDVLEADAATKAAPKGLRFCEEWKSKFISLFTIIFLSLKSMLRHLTQSKTK